VSAVNNRLESFVRLLARVGRKLQSVSKEAIH